MDDEAKSRAFGGLRPSDNTAIEESGLLGTRRGWTNINRYEIFFLIVGILAAIATDILTIMRLLDTSITSPDRAYGLLILVNSIFLLIFLFTGILYQRVAHIVAFCTSAFMLTIYVIAHYITRSKDSDNHGKTATIRIIRLSLTIGFNICFIPLAFFIIRDYRRDEFSKRLFGAFPAARRPLKIYNTFDCIARINTMLSASFISTFVLNLYNFNDFKNIDTILLSVGIPLAFLWLSAGIGAIRLEHVKLLIVFYLISILQPVFLGFALFSAITSATNPISTTTIATTTTITITTATKEMTTTPTKELVSVPTLLYVCIGANILTHISSMVLGFICYHNFGKGLKERVFNNKLDKWFQNRWPTA